MTFNFSNILPESTKFPWFRNVDGRPDAVLTFAAMAMFTVLFKLVFAGASFSWPPHFTLISTPIDTGTIAAVLLPTLGAYVSNKYVNLNYHPDYVNAKNPVADPTNPAQTQAQ